MIVVHCNSPTTLTTTRASHSTFAADTAQISCSHLPFQETATPWIEVAREGRLTASPILILSHSKDLLALMSTSTVILKDCLSALDTNTIFLRYDDGDRSFGGETYRPSDRNAPPRSDYRGYRSPPRRGRTPPPYPVDTYAPSSRRRSRSPAYRGRDGGSYRGRPRSPQRGYSPRRDVRARSPIPRTRRYSRSPVSRPRSPLPMRREPSPYRRPRSPLPAKRERIVSPPRERYDRRGYSPHRTARPAYPIENNYRPRERSPSPPRRSQHVSRMASPVSSRRSSPRVHPDRMVNTGSGQHSPAYRSSRPLPRDMSNGDRSPPRRAYSPIPRSPPLEPVAYRNRSPPPRDREDYSNGPPPAKWSDEQIAKPQSSSYRNGDSRPPPSGPAYRGSARETAPEAPSTAPISMSAHNRPSSASVHSAPTRPRGGPSFAERGARDHHYGGPPPHRGGRPPAASPYHGPPPRQHYDSRPPSSDHAPYNSRSSQHGPPGSYEAPYRAPPPFRSNNSSSTTYPRTQRFNHLASTPTIKENGEALPSLLDPAAKKRLTELEEGRKKLMEQIEEKQREKRRNLREWENRERESRRDGLRSELAEEALEAMSGDGPGTGTAF